MLLKPKECFGCPLYMVPNGGFSAPEGRCDNGVLVVGEALGQKEKMDGLPLRPHAESGSVLQTVFRRLERQEVAQSDRLDFGLTNIIRCQPPHNLFENQPYEYEAAMHCRIHFQRELLAWQGKVKCILALGNVPLRHLCPEIDELVKNAKLEKNKKQLKKLGSTSLRGYAFNSILGVPIISTIHPSFIARGERLLLHVLKRDVYFAMQVAKNGVPEFQHNYIVDPTLEQANEFYEICRRNSNLAISYDIETPDTILETDETEIEYENIEVRDINSIQFSCESGKGIFLNWDGADFTNIAAKILSLPNTKLGWNNWKFDQTNLEYHLGKNCVKGQNLDVMWEWKHANPDFVKVGRALQFATNFFAPEFRAWKHLSESDPKNYGCLHAEARVVLYDGSNKRIKDIVENKEDILIRGMSLSGKIVPVKISNWNRVNVTNQKWIAIETDISRQPIYCTPDHEILVNNIWKRADCVEIGDVLKSPRIGDPNLVHGMLLGDGHVDKRGRLSCHHTSNQKDWLNLKRIALDGPLYSHKTNCKDTPSGTIRGNFEYYSTEVWISRLWRRKFFHRNGHKIFVAPTSPEALAVWYCDDGTLANNIQPRITSHIFDKNEVIKYLENEFGAFSISFYADTRNKSEGGSFAIKEFARDKFFKYIREFIPPCMDYKLPSNHRGYYNNWLDKKVSQDTEVISLSSPYLCYSRNKNTRYCLTVEDQENTHRFFTLGGLIKNCFDTDAVKRIDNGLTPALKEKRFAPDTKSLYEGYIDDIVNLRPILLDMTARGLPIDMEAREEMRKMLVAEIRKTNKAIQELYPFQLRKTDPIKGYKFVPKEINELTERFNEQYRKPSLNEDNRQYIIFGDKEDYQLYLSKFIEQHSRIKKSKKRDGTVVEKEITTTGLILLEFNIDGVKEKRWCRMEKFKAGSTQQVIKYIEYKGYKVPTTKDFRKGDKPTTTKDKISELFESTGDKLFEYIVYSRELRKLKSTYVDSKRKGWIVGKDNRIHAEFLPLPATGQLSSKIHNAPARGTRFSSKGYKALADQFRKTIRAGPGKLLLSGDWSAFHALTLGFEAEDAEYMRLVRLDVHSYVAAYILAGELPFQHAKFKVKKPDKMEHDRWIEKVAIQEETLFRLKTLTQWLALPDDQLKEQLVFIKKNYGFTRNSQAKPAILGMGFGMREHKFYKLNRYSFANVKQCEELIETIRKLFPKTFVDFHKNILERADRDEFLISRYGYIRWFNDVFDWRMVYAPPKTLKMGERLIRSKGRLYHVKLGNDSNKAIAFLPANDAFGCKKEKMRELYQYQQDGIIVDKLAEFSMINEIHDDLMFEVEENKVEEAAKIVKEVMSRPAKYLKNSVAKEGLITGVEMKCGKNWGPFSEKDNPNGMKELKI